MYLKSGVEEMLGPSEEVRSGLLSRHGANRYRYMVLKQPFVVGRVTILVTFKNIGGNSKG